MLTSQQQRFRFSSAVQTPPPRRNLVIEAGAGTGKTTAIVAEVLKLLLSNADLHPERIVLVTFTEKAAGEIADRIHSALTEIDLHFGEERVVWPIGSPTPLFEVPSREKEAYRRACAMQLSRIEDLRSQTIHSFCQSLLRQYPLEAGLDPQFRVIEGFERSQLYGEIYDAWIDDETRLHPSAQAIREWEALLDHAGYLFQARKLIFNLIDRRDLLLDESYTLGEIGELEPALLEAVRMLRLCRDTQSGIVRYVRDAAAPPAGSPIDDWIRYFAPIAPLIRTENLRRDGTSGAMKVLRCGDNKGSSIYDLLLSHRASVALLSLTLRFLDRLDVEKRARGVVDFDDLLIRTLALLDDTSVLERIRQQFDFIFVDEFQDTDRIQARIIERMAVDASGAFVPGKTIVVGDPKQSIYGFRHADPELYDAMTRRLIEGGAESRLLVDQYRSEPPLLEAINALFADVFAGGKDDPNVFRPPYHPLRARRELENAGDARLTFLACEYEESRFTREAEIIADWIEREQGDRRRFAILFRRLTYIDAYLDVLDRRGVPYVLPPTRVFLDRPAPVDLLAVLRAIAYPIDRGAEISAARTPYFALSDDEIVSGGPAYQSFRSTLAALREEARHLTVAQLIDHLAATTNIEAVYRSCADSGRALRHLEHVRALAFAYEQSSGGSVRQFVDEIDRRRGEPDEVEPALFDETQDAVRILTIHAAKGLEFETVILPDLEFSSSGPELFTVEEPRSLVFRRDVDSLSGYTRRSGDRLLRELAGLREDAEMRRLFYVAVTRAQRDVVFIYNVTDPQKRGFVKYLPVDASMWPADAGRKMIEWNGVPLAFERMPLRAAQSQTQQRLLDRALEAQLAAAPAVPLILPTPATGDRRPATFTTSSDRAAGILLHRVLERWDGSSPIEPLVEMLVREQAVEKDIADRVRRRLATIAKSEMLQRIARAETIGREMPVAFIDDDGGIVEKRIDRLIRENGHDTVIDYKSGRSTRERLEIDGEQVRLYCAAVGRLTGRPCTGVLWYIDDKSDVVVDVN